MNKQEQVDYADKIAKQSRFLSDFPHDKESVFYGVMKGFEKSDEMWNEKINKEIKYFENCLTCDSLNDNIKLIYSSQLALAKRLLKL